MVAGLTGDTHSLLEVVKKVSVGEDESSEGVIKLRIGSY